MLNFINYRGGCGWINSPKRNLSCKLALLWESEGAQQVALFSWSELRQFSSRVHEGWKVSVQETYNCTWHRALMLK